MRIGVFDSGLGGITVLKKLIEVYPENEYIYYADLKNMPYGLKTSEQLNEIAINVLKKLEEKNIDMYVCACGTLSSVAMHNMTKYLDKKNKKIIGIIDPIVKNIKKYDYKNILIIATSATVKKAILEKRINEVCPNSNIYVKACPDFVEAIENHSEDNELLLSLTQKYLAEYDNKVDIVVCGCTHYILYKKYINLVLKNVVLLEAGSCIADELKLSKTKTKTKNNVKCDDKNIDYDNNKTVVNIILSKNSESFKINVTKILNNDLNNCKLNICNEN